MPDRVYNVLFLCTGNSARSVMAEALVNKLGRGRFRGFSGGSYPTGTVHPLAAREVTVMGYDPASLRSKSWDEFAAPDAPHMDFVITVCDQAAGEICPVWPGHPIAAHWSFPDPARVEGDDEQKRLAFSRVAFQLATRIQLLLNLPIDKLDRMALESHLRGLSGAEPAAA